MFLCVSRILLLSHICNCYVFDTDYPIIVKTDASRAASNSQTDHFGFSLDLAKYSDASSWLWVGAPKGLTTSGVVTGTLNACNLNYDQPFCEQRQDGLNSFGNEDNFTDQLFGITVNTIHTPSQPPEVY